jgi:hypothetical protein
MCTAPHPEPNVAIDAETGPQAVFEGLLAATIAKHPLPWRIEDDWLVEVIDAKGVRVVCYQLHANAAALVAAATQWGIEDAAAAIECDRMIAELEAEVGR